MKKHLTAKDIEKLKEVKAKMVKDKEVIKK